jgi:threonine dehydratase
MSDTLAIADIWAARQRIAPHIVRTPLVPSPNLSAALGRRISIKLEFMQATESFKVRGAWNKILQLDAAARERGIVAVSGGNHAKAVASVAGAAGVRAVICMPESAPAASVAYTRGLGAEVRLFAAIAEAFAHAAQLAAEGMTYVHPFADPTVVAGQGTIGPEILEDAPDASDVVISIGGGGLIGGIGLALKTLRPALRVWGVETAGADAMRRALDAGAVVQMPAITSIASTLGAPAASPLTLALAQRYVDDVLVVPDAEAVADMQLLLEQARLLVEPAAAVTLSAVRRLGERIPAEAHVVLVLCGASVGPADLAGWRARFNV